MSSIGETSIERRLESIWIYASASCDGVTQEEVREALRVFCRRSSVSSSVVCDHVLAELASGNKTWVDVLKAVTMMKKAPL